ncbi:hypothetical protein VAR608DRAFT_2708 [Variovorax sp. HW608]|uniref:hypothetical protein n=1 Tax=Variovorax sp. HW608 TaxID=1034889 RepID=UPI00081FF30A|nr:hypothetical protein [Variovorax sp. HW608]SCK31511.1 hypothetical protein VAR608DRAFT_2708 [Variovorax sp. HW608]
MDRGELSFRMGGKSHAPVRGALASCAAALILAACGGGGGGGGGAALVSAPSGAAGQAQTGQTSTAANGAQSSLATDLLTSTGSSPSGNTTPVESVGPGSDPSPGAFTKYAFKVGPYIDFFDPDVAQKVMAALATPELLGYEYQALASPVYVKADPGVAYTYWIGPRSEMNSIDNQTQIVALANEGPVLFRRPVVSDSFVVETALIDIQPLEQLVGRLNVAGSNGFCLLTAMEGLRLRVARRVEANPAYCEFQEWLTDHPVGDDEYLQKINELGAAGYKLFFNSYYVRDTTQKVRFSYEAVEQPPLADMTVEERVAIFNKMGATGALSYSALQDKNKAVYRRTFDCARRWFCGYP